MDFNAIYEETLKVVDNASTRCIVDLSEFLVVASDKSTLISLKCSYPSLASVCNSDAFKNIRRKYCNV